jgi:beta-aspartyl-peptidase (threonine type)
MDNFSIVVHGGAGPDSAFIREHMEQYKEALITGQRMGYAILEQGGAALDAVEVAVKYLEDDPLFNAGKGSALNEAGEVEMCAAIMDGSNGSSGAVAVVKGVRNPVGLAKAVMSDTPYRYIAGEGATRFAMESGFRMEEKAYFLTPHEVDTYHEKVKSKLLAQNGHGTVGAVARDRQGNIAAATSTGGAEFSICGRVADSSMVGAGVYASNATCAVSATGDGECIMKHVIAYDIAAVMEYKGLSVDEACRYVLKDKLKDTPGDIGIIAVSRLGEISMQFNAARMHRCWKTSGGGEGVAIY